MKLSNKNKVGTWLSDHLVGCASIVTHQYLAMSLTLELMAFAMT